MTAWKFKHPPRGSCEPKCGAYGRCHCPCQEPTNLASKGNAKRCLVRGRAFAFRSGHYRRVVGSQGASVVDHVGPLVDWLVGRYGAQYKVAALLGTSASWVSLVQSRKIGRVGYRRAKSIADVVLAHRRPRDPLRTFELDEPPRLAKPARREWTTKGLYRTPDAAKPLVTRIVRHLGGYSPAGRALADYYDLTPKTAQRMLFRLRKGEKRVRQGTIDHLEDFLEYIERECEAVA